MIGVRVRRVVVVSVRVGRREAKLTNKTVPDQHPTPHPSPSRNAHAVAPLHQHPPTRPSRISIATLALGGAEQSLAVMRPKLYRAEFAIAFLVATGAAPCSFAAPRQEQLATPRAAREIDGAVFAAFTLHQPSLGGARGAMLVLWVDRFPAIGAVSGPALFRLGPSVTCSGRLSSACNAASRASADLHPAADAPPSASVLRLRAFWSSALHRLSNRSSAFRAFTSFAVFTPWHRLQSD